MKRRSPLIEPLGRALLAACLVAAPAARLAAEPDSAPPVPGTLPASGEPAPTPSASAAASAPALAESQPPPAMPEEGRERLVVGSIVLTAQQFERDPETGLIIATGNPRAVRGEDEIRAERLLLNPATQQVTAEGNVYIRQGGQEFRADRATYSFPQREGQAEEVRSLLEGYELEAEQILLRTTPEGRPFYAARRARFTTCVGQEPPHYELYARELELHPQERFIARNVGLDLLGLRLVTLPRLQRSLREGERQDRLYPTLGYDSFNGPYAYREFTLREKPPVWLDADVKINTFREPNVGLLAATRGRLQAVGTLFYRDVAENQRSRHLQVSRLPEIGVVWSPRQRPRPGQFLPHQVTGVRYPEALDVSTRWRVAAMLSAGYFRQHRGDNLAERDGRSKDGARLSLQAQGVLPVVRLGPLRLNDLRLLARQSFYDTGDAFTVLGTSIGKKIRAGNFRFQLDRFDQFTFGSTPFLFDDLELRQEWRPRIEYRSPGFEFSYFARLRGDGRLYDQVFQVAKLFHCIQPRLTYRVRRQEVFLEIRIPGLSGFGRRSPAEPRTEDTGEEGVAPVQMQPGAPQP